MKRIEQPPATSDSLNTPRAQPVSILLAGGDATTIRLVDQLRTENPGDFELTRVSNRALALEHSRKHRPRVIIVDLQQSGSDEDNLLDALREASPDSAVIVITNHQDVPDMLPPLYKGAQDFLNKSSLSFPQLSRSICFAIERHRRICELQERIEKSEVEQLRFRTIVQTTTDAIVIVDNIGTICFVNDAAERLFGRSHRQLIGESFGSPIVVGATTELEIVRFDGSITVAELKAAETVWDDKPAVIASLRDVTERHLIEERERIIVREQAARAEAEASERRARFLGEAGTVLADSLDYLQTLRSLARLTVPFLADWCIVDILDENGKIERVAVEHADPAKAEQARALASFAPDRSTLLGSARALRTGRTELVSEVTDAYLSKLTDRQDYLDAMRTVQPSSALFVPLIARARAIGTITLIAAESGRRYNERDADFAEELAHRAAIAVDNARLYQEAQRANKSKADFLAIMSHELRTPLNAVIGYSDLLLMGVPLQLPSASRTHVERIRGSARHLLRLIEEILTYARMEAGREELNIEAFDATELVREAASMTEPFAQDKNLSVRVDVPDHPVILHSDSGKLHQILLNLLTNAVKFTDEGQIGLVFDFDGGIAQFTVWDTGIGMGPELRDQIFEPFWQAEQSRTRRAEGTGLGLTVARRLARLLGGDIEFESEPGIGTEFRVRIPPSIAFPASD